MKLERIQNLNLLEIKKGPVIYWMSRDQRTKDNWALLYAQKMAIKMKTSLIVIFCLVPHFLGATLRQYDFMLKGLKEVQKKLHNKNIPFIVNVGNPADHIPPIIQQYKAGLLVTDFDPLKVKRQWKAKVLKSIKIAFHEVDAHNIVPCWVTSQKQEYGAYTIRPKINRLLDNFLDRFPSLVKHPHNKDPLPLIIDIQNLLTQLTINQEILPIKWLKPGEDAAHKLLKTFITTKMNSYSSQRNDPSIDGQSNFSPYLHFGQISAQKIVLEILKSDQNPNDQAAFLEELIIRRELSDNFCYYNQNYDHFSGFPAWAQNTLLIHKSDQREYIYTLKQLERAETHDNLWNAAQKEMVKSGKMHGYMRMYWAKKILEWTLTPLKALQTAIYLNDKYELDGRDPNGYAGIAWSIGGTHDRAWGERPIWGKIRIMSFNGCKSKFDVAEYIDKVKKS